MCALVDGDGPSLFGHDGLSRVTLTIGLMRLYSGLTQVEALKEKYEDVFFSRDRDSKAFQSSY